MQSNLIKDQINCISLTDSTRKPIFENTIKTFGMEFVYFCGIDSKEFKNIKDEFIPRNSLLSEEQTIKYNDRVFTYSPHSLSYINNKFSETNLIACTFSHSDVYVKLLESNFDYFLIFEDDFRFTNNLKMQDLINDIQDIPDDCDICFFSPSHAHRVIYPKEYDVSPRIFKLKNKINYFSGASFYLITKSGATKILNIQGKDNYNFASDDMFSVLSCNDEPNFYMTTNLYGFGHCHVYPDMIERMNLI